MSLPSTESDLVRRREALHALGVPADDLDDADVMLWTAGRVMPTLPGWRDNGLGRWVAVVRTAPEVARAIVDWAARRTAWVLAHRRFDATFWEYSRFVEVAAVRQVEHRLFGVHGVVIPDDLPTYPGDAASLTWHELDRMAARLDRQVARGPTWT